MSPAAPVRSRPPARVADLPFGGQFSVWALRIWVDAERAHPALHETLRTAFCLIRLPDAYPAFNRFLSIVAHGCSGGVDTRGPNSRHLSRDERLFLFVLAAQQDGAIVSAYRTLLFWVSPAHARSAMAASISYVDLLSKRKLTTLHGRDPAPTRQADDQA